MRPLAAILPTTTTPASGQSLTSPRSPTEARAERSELAAMLGTMPSRAGSAIDAKATLAAFEDVLGEFPHAMVVEALHAFRAGKIGDGHFAPTPAEVAKHIRAKIDAAEDARRRVEAQERLERETLAERGRREAAWQAQTPDQRRAVVERLLGRGAGSRDKTTAPQWLEDLAGKPPRKVETFSPALVEKLEAMRAARAPDDARFADMDAYARETIG